MAVTDKMVTISLSENDVGQILDALFVRSDDWHYTQRYLEEGYEEPDRVIQDCSDAREARNIADCYDEIIAKIKAQS